MVRKNMLARLRRAVISHIWAHLPTLILAAVFLVAWLILLDETDEQISVTAEMFIRNLLGLLLLFLGFAAVLDLIWLSLTQQRNQYAGGAAMHWLIERNWTEILLLRVPLAFAITMVIGYLYVSFKVNIANFAPYSWDFIFAEIDRALFLGKDPWVLSHKLLPGALATKILDMFYVVWFPVMQMAIFLTALLAPRHPLRQTFLMAYVLNWGIAGVVLAILFPAVGPVYMERITGDPMFQPLMEMLYREAETTRIITLESQELLWKGYTQDDVNPIGISAFPSMHLTIAATLTCLGFAVNRIVGWLAAAFTLTILIGSVHLGWHYAIDGIAGIVLAVVLWMVSARVTRWWLDQTEPERGGQIAAEAR